MIFQNCKLKIEPNGHSGNLNFAFCEMQFSMSRSNSQIHEPGVSRRNVK